MAQRRQIEEDVGFPLFEPVGRPREGAAPFEWLARLVLVAAAVAYMLVVADLGWNLMQADHASAAESSIQPTPEPQPAEALRMGPVSTAVSAVDDALRGFLKGDVAAAFSQLSVEQVPCGTLPWEGAPALACVAKEQPGAPHDLVLSGCGATWVTPEAAKAELESLLADEPGLSAVTPVNGGYRAVLLWPGASDQSLVLWISSAGVKWYGTGCGLPPLPKSGRDLAFVATSAR